MPEVFLELKRARHAWDAIKAGNINDLRYLTLDNADIAKLREFMALLATTSNDDFHGHGFRVVSRSDAEKLHEYACYFGIRSSMDGKLVEILDEDDTGYEARPDYLRWYIRESFTCKTCGKQTIPFHTECKDCFDARKARDVEASRIDLQRVMNEIAIRMETITRPAIKQFSEAAEKFISARDREF